MLPFGNSTCLMPQATLNPEAEERKSPARCYKVSSQPQTHLACAETNLSSASCSFSKRLLYRCSTRSISDVFSFVKSG